MPDTWRRNRAPALKPITIPAELLDEKRHGVLPPHVGVDRPAPLSIEMPRPAAPAPLLLESPRGPVQIAQNQTPPSPAHPAELPVVQDILKAPIAAVDFYGEAKVDFAQLRAASPFRVGAPIKLEE